MSRFLFFISITFWLFPKLQAQDFWQEGSITLKNNLSITGELAFDNDLQKIKYKSVLYEKTFVLDELVAFQFEDYELGIERYFITHSSKSDIVLLEIIVEGRYPVYRALETANTNLFNPLLTEEDFKFYISIDNSMVPLTDFKEKVLAKITWDYPFEVRDFIYRYNLNTHVKSHIVLIMQHYNALTSPNLDHSRTQKLLSIR